ncbi:hypothetical protein [Spirillospora sp. CA-294931]|uniref:hypothetical protein n=1 Tax=Spirillospora sp. CA-294931 TaxID=3240042 RepID=UPI003D91B29B
MTWSGPAVSLDTSQPVNLWECGACCTEWAIPVTHWPVLHGPDCPFCGSQITTWAALAPEHNGDLWLCEWGHEYLHTPDGLIVVPGEA